MEVREAHASMGSSKIRQRPSSIAAQMPAKPARAVRAIHVGRVSSASDVDSCGSDTEKDRRNVYMAESAGRAPKPEDPLIRSENFEQERHYNRGKSQTVCTNCGSKIHDDRGC